MISLNNFFDSMMIAEEGFFDRFKKNKKPDEPMFYMEEIEPTDVSIDSYPDLKNALIRIINDVCKEEKSELMRIHENPNTVTITDIWYANPDFKVCAWIQTECSGVRFDKIISDIKRKHANLFKKYDIILEHDEFKLCDAIYVSAMEPGLKRYIDK